MTQQHPPATQATKAPAAASKAVAGPLTMRDLVVLGAVAIIFIASVVPMVETLTGDLNLWHIAGLFYLAIGVILPLAVGALFLVRRLSPEVKIRIGSLSVDQFASVVAAFATFFFFVGTVSNFDVAYLIGLIGSLVFLVATVCAQWIPFFATDFADRVEVPAHVAARDAVAAAKRPAAPKPVAHQGNAGVQGGSGAQQGAGAQGGPGVGAQAVPGHYPPGQAAAQNAPVAQNSQGAWAGPQAAHTPAGQIFTPAKAAVPGSGGATAGAPASAAATAATPAATAGTPAGAAQGQPADAGSATSAASSATTHTPVVAQAVAPSASSAGPTAESKQGAAEKAAGSTPAGAVDAVAPSATAGASAATTLNPQIAEPAKERTAPASRETIAATVNPARAAAVAEPFWFAVDRPQNVIDEKTRQFVFKLMPGAWILALEDRGNSFLVQDSRGKTGLLLDLVGIERAPDSQ